MMDTSERNKQIKKVLVKEFGYKNVKVKGGKGTAYGWVNIYISVPKPHKGKCENPGWNGLCEQCEAKINETRDKVWKILRKTGLTEQLYTYYDDMGYKHKECNITVKLVDE